MTEFMGHPIEYWIELQEMFECGIPTYDRGILLEKIMIENRQMRGELSQIKSLLKLINN